jgi:uncharacterized protein YbjT (DUF2867 family)
MILVTGATGRTGSEVVRQLAAAGQPVRALVRDKRKAEAIAGADAGIAEGDLAQPDTLGAALEGVDALYLVSGPAPELEQLEANALEAARDAGVRHVVKQSVAGASARSPLHLGRWHHNAERRLESSGMGYTILRPNFSMNNFFDFTRTIQAEGTFHAGVKDAKVSMIDCRDVAAVAVVTLTQSGHEGQTYILTGPEAISFYEAAEVFSEELGKQITYVEVSSDQVRDSMLQAGMPLYVADDMKTLHDYMSTGHAAEVTDVVPRLTHATAHAFRDFVRAYAPIFNGRL